MNSCPIFYPSLFSSTENAINLDLWDKCVEAFDAGKYLESFHLLLDYINTDLRSYGNAEGTEFNIPHGSIVVNISLKDDKCCINAPFLEVNPKSIVPLLRQVCSLNFNNLDLAQIYLHDEQLNFQYSCKISEIHPYKMYYIFREICATGDRYDDEYVTEFGAKRLQAPLITPFAPSRAEEAYKTIQKMIVDALAGISFLESKRWYGLAWDLAALTLRQINFYARPQGQLRNEMAEAIANMHGREIPIAQLLEVGKVYLKELQNMDKNLFISNLYEIETFTPEKSRISLQSLQDKFEDEQNRSKESKANGNYINIVLGILYIFYNTYYHNSVSDDISRLMNDAMQRASGKNWENAATILSDALDKIMDGELTVKKGLFNRLFGK